MLSPVQAYTLAMTLQGPINGRVSDIVGRKPMLYAAIAIFTVFSALCGAAKSMTWWVRVGAARRGVSPWLKSHRGTNRLAE